MPTLRVPQLAGMNERPSAPANMARRIVNLRFDASEGRWVNDRGWRSYLEPAPARGSAEAPIESIGIHQTRGGATTDIFLEGSTGTDMSLFRLSPFDSDALTSVQTGRHLPGTNEPSTCFASFGEVCIAVNGHDAPIRIYPMTGASIVRSEPFGFPTIPPAPIISDISSETMRLTATAYYYALSVDTSDVTIAFPPKNTIGLGDPTPSDPAGPLEVANQNTYIYKYSWVTDTGSESPVSAESTAVTWQTNGDGYRYGVLVTGIIVGPPGTVKRRIYRTRNLGETQLISDASFYFLADIPNNYETAFADQIPDGLLGSAAPDALISAQLPAEIRWATSFGGRLWIVSGDYRIHWSTAQQVEAFGAANFVDVSNRNGGRVTGLMPYNDLLFILREHSIEAIVATQDRSFRAVPVLENIGTIAPHAAVTVPGLGVVIVSNDGIYAVRGTFSGGSQISTVELTDVIEWSRVNTAALAKAWAWYNYRDREVVFALPADGNTYPTMQMVLHLDTPGGPSWSQRDANTVAVAAACGITGPEGWPYIGCQDASLTPAIQPVLLGVWAAYDQNGYDVADETYDTPQARPEAFWESTDLDLGNSDQTKVARYVTATVSSYGSNAIYLDCFFDGGWQAQGTTQESPTHTLDRTPLTILGTASPAAVIDTDLLSRRGVSEIRFDLSNYQFRRIRLRFRSDKLWAIYGFAVHFDEQGPPLPFSPVVRATTFNTPNAPSVSVPVSKRPGGIG